MLCLPHDVFTNFAFMGSNIIVAEFPNCFSQKSAEIKSLPCYENAAASRDAGTSVQI